MDVEKYVSANRGDGVFYESLYKLHEKLVHNEECTCINNE